jgi:very-short-patch-repair endonuclease
VCASRRLVVEVDSAHHARRRGADARRDAVLARLGYRVLRLEARMMFRQLEVAVEVIMAAVVG